MKYYMLLLVCFCVSHASAITAFELMQLRQEARQARIVQDEEERRARGVPITQEQQKTRQRRNRAWWKRFAWEVVKEMGSNAPQSKL